MHPFRSMPCWCRLARVDVWCLQREALERTYALNKRELPPQPAGPVLGVGKCSPQQTGLTAGIKDQCSRSYDNDTSNRGMDGRKGNFRRDLQRGEHLRNENGLSEKAKREENSR